MSVAILCAAAACLAAGAAIQDLVRARMERPPARAPRPGRERATVGERRWRQRPAAQAAAEQLVDAAGRGSGVPSVAALHGRQVVAAVVGAAWGGALGLVVGGPVVAALAAPCAGVAGRQLPAAALRAVARRRAERVRDEVPEAAALLAAAAACGLPLGDMLTTAGAWLDGDLPDGLAVAARDLQRGAAPVRVLAAIQRDHPVDEVVALVAILQRGREHGVGVTAALDALASGARAARARRAADRAARAVPRIQLLAALLLVPAALCILASAIVAGGLR